MQQGNLFISHISIGGGHIYAFQCQALSKRSKLQSEKAALKGKRVCMFHGGKRTGPSNIRRKRGVVQRQKLSMRMKLLQFVMHQQKNRKIDKMRFS